MKARKRTNICLRSQSPTTALLENNEGDYITSSILFVLIGTAGHIFDKLLTGWIDNLARVENDFLFPHKR